MKQFGIFLLVSALLLSSCSAPAATPVATPEPQTLTVFAAASLTNAFGEIGKGFEAVHPGVSVKFNFGGSQALRTQIEQGARADIFASANTKEMQALVTGGFVAADSAKTFTTNRLVVILPANNPAGLAGLVDLGNPGLKLVLAAKEVPAGNYALQMLDQAEKSLGAGYRDRVLANVVSYENDVRQVVAKVQLGEADAGIVYQSDTVAAPELKKIEIPAGNNIIAKYPLAALSQAGTPDPELAQDFIAYVLSTEGQSILQKWGFLPVK